MSLDPADNVKLPDWVADLERWHKRNYGLMHDQVGRLFRELRETLVALHDIMEDRGLSPTPTDKLDSWVARNPFRRHYLLSERVLDLMCIDFSKNPKIDIKLRISKGWDKNPPRVDDFFYAGKKSRPATTDELILFALAKWQELHGDTDIQP